MINYKIEKYIFVVTYKEKDVSYKSSMSRKRRRKIKTLL